MTYEDAKELLLNNVQTEVKHETAQMIKNLEDQAKEEAERILSGRGEAMDVAEAQAKLAEAVVQLQALERLRKTLKH